MPISNRGAFESRSVSPANCPAEVRFVIEISAAMSGESPLSTHIMPKTKATET